MNLSSALYAAALIIFALVTFGVGSDDVNLLALGLALIAGGLLASSTYDRRIG